MATILRAAIIAAAAAMAASLLIPQPAQAAKRRPPEGFAAALPAPAPQARVADGAIFNVSNGYAGLVEGHRARAVGDPLTILLVEQVTTSKSAGSKTQRQGSFSVLPPHGRAARLPESRCP